MGDISVPDFKSLEDFQEWVRGLDKTAVQSWKTDDWLKMYEKVDAYVASEDFTKVYKEKVSEVAGKGRFSPISSDIYLQAADNVMARRMVFMELTADYWGSMYRNYRFEPEQSAYIRKIAKQAGEKLAARDFDAAELVMSDDDDFILSKCQEIDDITRKGTHYGETSGRVRCINILDRKINDAGLSFSLKDGWSCVKINPNWCEDQRILVMFHEYAHIYNQAQNPLQREMAKKGILAHPELGSNFQKLMEKNIDYYLACSSIQSCLDGTDLSLFSESKQRAILRRVVNGYRKQPSERYSNLYGFTAERSFRAASGQGSELNAIRVVNIISGAEGIPPISGVPVIDKPIYARYVPEGIELNYSVKGYTVEELEKAIKGRFAGADEKLIKDLNISVNNGQELVKVIVPSDYSFSTELDKFIRTPPPSAVLGGGETATSAATAVAKMEARLADRGGEKVTQTVVKTAVKKKGLLVKAAVANAKFDRAVDKTIEKGVKVLNNSAAGKVYRKAAAKVGGTRTAQVVSKTVSKGAQKVASTAAGKAVTKTVAKAAGSAVGKSVLKKIPLVSAGAGAYFAWERIKDGQWKSAGCEMLSGIAGCFPGIGTAASLAIDAGLAANDIHEVVKSNNKSDSKKKVVPVVKQQPKPKSADLGKQNKPKVVKKTTLTAAQQRALSEKAKGRT